MLPCPIRAANRCISTMGHSKASKQHGCSWVILWRVRWGLASGHALRVYRGCYGFYLKHSNPPLIPPPPPPPPPHFISASRGREDVNYLCGLSYIPPTWPLALLQTTNGKHTHGTQPTDLTMHLFLCTHAPRPPATPPFIHQTVDTNETATCGRTPV